MRKPTFRPWIGSTQSCPFRRDERSVTASSMIGLARCPCMRRWTARPAACMEKPQPATLGFPLELVLSPTRDYVPLMGSSESKRIAAEYQAELLHYRLVNRAEVHTPSFDLSQFTGPMQEVAYSLAAPIVGADELQSQMKLLLRPFDSEIRVDRASQLSAIVLEALLARCHGTTGQHFPVLDLTGDVNTILRGRGAMFEVSPEIVGWRLRALGLHTESLPRGRKGVVLLNDVPKKIHDLAAAYGVRTLSDLPVKVDCPLCAALALSWERPA